MSIGNVLDYDLHQLGVSDVFEIFEYNFNNLEQGRQFKVIQGQSS